MDARQSRPTSDRIGRLLVLAGTTLTVQAVALAGPEGGRVVHGGASIERAGPITTIRAQNNAILAFDRFDISAHETVRFLQPTVNSRVLNRITGNDPSIIAGSLLANGQVYIVNPAGIYFTGTSIVDVGGLYAAAGNMTNQDFLANVDTFTLSGVVSNHGLIQGSAIHLLGREVANHGTIIADEGIVALGSGDEVLMGAPRTRIYAKPQVGPSNKPHGSVENSGNIQAERVAIGAGDLFSVALRSSSSIQARQVEIRAGRGSRIDVAGDIDASTSETGQHGGAITVVGQRVAVDDATLDASGPGGGGTIEIGGGYRGAGEHRARRVSIGSGTTLRADATAFGDGGRVITWADHSTTYDGLATARGGPEGGDGGLVETSGKVRLRAAGLVDASAPRGKGGLWLLDPLDVVISDATTTPPVGGVFSPGASGATVSATDIRDVLESGTNVLVTTDVAGPETGNITWLAGNPLVASLVGVQTLTLDANGSIDLQSDITATGAALDLVLESGTGVLPDSVGDVGLADGISIDLNGGVFTASGAGAFIAGQTHTIAASALAFDFDGNVTLRNTLDTNLAASSTDDTFDITAPTVTVAGTLAAGNGVVLDGDAVLSADLSAGTGGVRITGATAVSNDVGVSTTGGGDIEFSGVVDGAVAGANDLDLSAGTGSITLGDDVGGTTRLGGFTINSANDVNATAIRSSSLQQVSGTGTTSISTLNVSGASGATLSGAAFDLGAIDAATGGLSISASGDIDLAGSLDVAGDVDVVSGGVATVSGSSFDAASFLFGGAGSARIGSDVSSNGDIVFDVPLQLTQAAVFESSVGNIEVNSTLQAGANDLALSANGINLSGGVGSVGGTGNITFQPIGNGDSIGIVSAGDLSISGSTLAALDDGFSRIIVGRGSGAHDIAIGAVSFSDPVLYRAPTGTASLDAGLTMTDLAGVEFDAGELVVATALGVSTDGGSITAGGVRLADGIGAAFSSAGGHILIDGPLLGTAGGAAESLAFDAGAGDVTIDGVVSGLSDLSFLSARNASLQSVTLTGTLETTASLTGDMAFGGAVDVARLDVSAATVSFADALSSTNEIVIATPGGATLFASMDAGGDITVAGPVELRGDVESVSGDVTLTGSTLLGSTVSVRALAGTLQLSAVDTDGNDLGLRAGEIDLAGGASSVGGGGALLIEPASDGTAIALGSAAGVGSGLDLGQDDLDALALGFDSVTVGRAAGSHSIQIGDTTFRNSTVLRSPNGQLAVSGIVDSSGSDLTLTGSTLLGNTILTGGGDLLLTGGGVTLQVDGVLDTTNGGAGGAVTIIGDVDSADATMPRSLAITAGSGDVTLGDTGRTRSLASFSLGTTGAASLGGLVVNGDLAITAADTMFRESVTAGGDATITSDVIITGTFEANQDLVIAGSVVLSGDSILRSGSGAVRVDGPIEGDSSASPRYLTIEASNGDVELLGSVGAAGGVGDVVIDSGGTVSAQSIRSAGDVSLNGADLLLGGGLVATGSVELDGPLHLGGDIDAGSSVRVNNRLTLLTDTEVRGEGVQFFGTINGDHELAIDGRGDAAELRSPVGGTTALSSLQIGGASARFGDVLLDGALVVDAAGDVSFVGSDVVAGSIDITGSRLVILGAAARELRTTGGVLRLPDIELGASPVLTLASSGGNIVVSGLSSVSQGSLDAFAGAGTIELGGASGLERITIVARDVDLTGSIEADEFSLQPSNAARPIVLGGPGGSAGLELSAAELARLSDGFRSIVIGRPDGTGGIDVLGGTLRAPLVLDGGLGSVRVSGSLAGVGNAILTVRGSLIEFGGSITTQGGAILFEAPVLLFADSSLVSQGGDWSTADGIEGAFALNADVGSGAIDIGDDVSVASLDLSAAAIDLGNETRTSGSQRFAGVLRPGERLVGGSIIVLGPMQLTGDTRIESSGDVELGAVDGNAALVIRAGDRAQAGPIGGTTALRSLDIEAASAFLESVRTSGNVRVRAGDISVGDNLLAQGTGSILLDGSVDVDGAVTIRSNATGADAIVFTGRVDGESDLRLRAPNGDIALASSVGSEQALRTFDVGANSIRVSDVATSGMQRYDAGAHVSGTLTGSEIAFERGITLVGDTSLLGTGSGGVHLLSTVDGAFALDIDADQGIVQLEGPVGTTVPLARLSLSGETNRIGDVFTAGEQTYNGATELLGNLEAVGPVRFQGRVVLPGDASVSSHVDGGVGIELLQGADGPGSLTLRAPNAGVALLGRLGEEAELGMLTIVESMRTRIDGSVRADSVRVLDGLGSVVLNGSLVATGTGGIELTGQNIAIDASIAAPMGPLVINNAGMLELNENLDLAGVSVLSQVGSGGVRLGTDILMPDGSVSFLGPVSLLEDRRIDAQSIEFRGAVDSDGTARSLSLLSQGDVSLLGPIGLDSTLASLETDAGGATRLGADVVVLGAVTFGDPVVLVGDTSIRAGETISFAGAIDGVAGNPADLVLATDVSGDGSDGAPLPIVEFGGDVGAVVPIGSLSVNAGGRDSVPVVPTILRTAEVVDGQVVPGSGDLRIVSLGDIEFGEFEKLSVLGDVALSAEGSVTLGDITALGEVRVTAPEIRLLSRPSGFVLTRFDFLDEDSGVDFVSGSGFTFSTEPVVVGGGPAPSFASPTGGDDRLGTLRSYQQRLYGEVALEDMQAGSTRLDLRSLGPSNTNVAEALAGAAPRVAGGDAVERDAFVDAAQRAKLQRLGIFARETPGTTRWQALAGRALYEDYGSFHRVGEFARAEVNEVTVDRLSGDRVQRALDAYDAMFASAEGEASNAAMLREMLTDEVEMYLTEQDVAATLGAAFAEHVQQQGTLVDDLRRLSGLRRELEALGLSPKERQDAWGVVLGQVRPEFMLTSEFEALLAYLDRPVSLEQETSP
ncbi:MAG: filamentous hemagglutinin N-terminal domain-containing protein [Phycisphaera sp.]|nr:MAG: filamentous hemagglutinin N-terminal domain-containing protein [Phycisphaera sp.]